MHRILTVIFAGSALLATAQTPLIAHKSHSGAAADFFIDPNTNFGDPGPQLIQIVRLNDSTYIEVYNSFSGMTYHDTIYKSSPFKHYQKNVDSIYQLESYQHVEYINLQNKADSTKVKAPSFRFQKLIETPKTNPEKSISEPVQEPAPKRKKRSYLLFLFGITGGGLLMLRLLNRLFSPQVVS